MNEDGVAFSIGLAEYSIAYFMRTVLKSNVAITIVTPNSLQRDLTMEVYAKKRTVSGRFADTAPHVITIDEITACLPSEYTIYCDVGADESWTRLEELAGMG